MTAIELVWSCYSSMAYGESWYAATEAIHMVLAFFVIAPWACRRALGIPYSSFRILTFGYGATTPKQISYLESFKVAWLLGWRSGVLGIVFLHFGCEAAPLLLGFILGPMMEENLRRAMLLSRGDPTVFVTRPLSLVMLLMALAMIVIISLPAISKKREETFVEE